MVTVNTESDAQATPEVRVRVTSPLTTALYDYLKGSVEGLSIAGNTIKFTFGDFGTIGISPRETSAGGAGSRASRIAKISIEDVKSALLDFIGATGDTSASGYEKWRKASPATAGMPTANVIKISCDGKWIANEVLKDMIMSLRNGS